MTWRIEVTEKDLCMLGPGDWLDTIVPILQTLGKYNSLHSWWTADGRTWIIEGDYTLSLDPAIHRERLSA